MASRSQASQKSLPLPRFITQYPLKSLIQKHTFLLLWVLWLLSRALYHFFFHEWEVGIIFLAFTFVFQRLVFDFSAEKVFRTRLYNWLKVVLIWNGIQLTLLLLQLTPLYRYPLDSPAFLYFRLLPILIELLCLHGLTHHYRHRPRPIKPPPPSTPS